MVFAWPELPNAKSGGAQCGAQGMFAVGGIETRSNWPGKTPSIPCSAKMECPLLGVTADIAWTCRNVRF